MTSERTKSIGEKTAEGSGWIVFTSGSRKAVGFIASIVLARVLFPSDFGLIAMANVVIGLLGVIDGYGVLSFLVYKGKEGEDYGDTAFWLNVCLGLLLTLITWLSAPAAAAGYGNAEIEPILRALAFVFLFGSLNPVHRAMLRRDMRFGELSRRSMLLDLVSTLITVSLALSGYGVWSFVVPALVRPLANTFLLWRLCRWRPRIRIHKGHLGEIVGYGRFVVGTDLADMGLRYADFILIGHLLGAEALGIYSFAYFSAVAISGYVQELSGFVVLPMVASIRENQKELEKWGSQFLRAVSLLVFPVLAGQFVVGRDYILSLYGDRWADAIVPFRILLLLGLLAALARPAVPMLRAAGKPELPFRVTLITLPILAGALLFTVSSGVQAAAYTVAIVLGSSRLITLLLGLRALGLSIRRVLREGVPSALAALFFVVVILAFDPILIRHVSSPVIRLMIEVPMGALLYFLFLAVFFRETLNWGTRRVLSMLPPRARTLFMRRAG